MKTLHRYTQFVTACTFILIVAGGLVTSTGSGLSVPDWPLSYGQWMPPMIGGIRFEHTHRMIAAFVGLLTLALTVSFLLAEKRKWVRGLAGLALALVIAQAILGGITVKYFLPAPVSIAHACLAQTFFTLLACLCLFTSREWTGEPSPSNGEVPASFKRLAVTTYVFVYLQLVAGAAVRHLGAGALKPHFALAFLVAVHALWMALKTAWCAVPREKLFRHAALLGGLVVAQLFSGFAAFVFKFMLGKPVVSSASEVLLATFHQANSSLILAGTALFALRSFRLFKTAPEPKSGLAPGEKLLQYLALTKPRLTLAASATTLLGFFLASRGETNLPLLGWTLGASLLIGGGANTLNQLYEKNIDAKMKRTQNRPLPSGRLKENNALVLGATLSTFGVLCLFFFVNTLAAGLGLLILLSYVGIYTPLKQKTPLNTFVGAVPGALPAVMGWAAGRNALDLEAGVLFLMLFVWQLPHFLAIAWVHKDDYRKSGLNMLTLNDAVGTRTAGQIVFYCLLLLPVSLVPFFAGLSGKLYLTIAAISGGALTLFALQLLKKRLTHARQFVSASIVYLLLNVFVMMGDKR